MNRLTRMTGLFIIVLLAVIPWILSAGTVGKIRGTVTDKETGDPIPGASIQIVGTTQGAMTDPDGKYLIQLVPPGTYTIRCSSVSYHTVEVSGVQVVTDITTHQDIQMEQAVTDLSKVIRVTADRDIIDKFKTSNEIFMSRKDIEAKPIQNVDQLLKQTQGVVTNSNGEVLIRGGRAKDNAHIVEGGRDPLDGQGPGRTIIASPQMIPQPPDEEGCIFGRPAHGGTNIVNGEPYDAMFFKDYGTNPFVDTEDDHLSTFATDVDDASFVMVRSYLERGHLPPDEAVRAEEFINHFTYNYDPPRGEPFSVNAEGAPSHFGTNCKLLKIGIQGKILYEEERRPANLVFVIDVSGSMSGGNRLEMVKRALTALIDHLNPDDQVGIVVYGTNARIILNPTSIRHRREIVRAIRTLHPEGATNAEAGLKLGYRMADNNFNPHKINRIILCSDGVANVGITSADQLLKKIRRYAERGINLTTVGFGMGNYNDILMEKLGNKGNGMYAYVDDFEQARRVFLDNLTGMLQVIARDVKIQVDFNPEVVRSYRLIGYENRDVADHKFRDDREDGGEIGAGHQVTALYEIKFRDEIESNLVGTVFIRYKEPFYDEVTEIRGDILTEDFYRSFEQASSDLKLAAAAAEFAEILGHSYWARNGQLTDVYNLVKRTTRYSRNEQTDEFLKLIRRAQTLQDELAEW